MVDDPFNNHVPNFRSRSRARLAALHAAEGCISDEDSLPLKELAQRADYEAEFVENLAKGMNRDR